MTIQVIKADDSVQQWISKINRSFDTAIGQFYIDPKEYTDKTLLVTAGRYRNEDNDIIVIEDTFITFSIQGEYYIGVDLDNEVIDYQLTSDPVSGSFYVLYIVQVSETRILSVDNFRCPQFLKVTP
jgi:hypothetical protein